MDLGLGLNKAFQFLDNPARREAARTRRKALLKGIYHIRYQTRKGLSWRLDWVLEVDCSWWDTSSPCFILDIWFVRRTFQATGYQLAYSWVGDCRGFYLRGEGAISLEMVRAIRGAVAEIDPRQVEITRRLTPAQRVQQGVSITNLAHNVARYRKDMGRR